MAKIAVKVVDRNSSRIRSYVEFEGHVDNMHIEINTYLATLALVAPIRLNATRELLDRVQGHIPEDYYSRFDRYNRDSMLHSNLVSSAEKGPVCANEFGFTRALAACNDLECHYYADQNYHLLMKPFAGFDCINRTKVEYNGVMDKRRSEPGDMYVTYGSPTVEQKVGRFSCYGFSGFDFREYDWPNGRVKGRGALKEMPLVRYTYRPKGLDAKTRLSSKLKKRLQHAISLHNAAEDLLRESRAPFGEYWGIGLEGNCTKEEVFE